MKPALCLRLYATQSQPCFPAASNVLALPVGNLIFAATPTERITHYTLQAKSCAKGIPFGNPFLSECVATLPPKCKISGIGQPVPGADLYRLFAYMGFLLYRPYKPFQFITSVWSDGTMILSKDEAAINALADLLEQLNGDMITGYFDPKEDRESGVVDECTGYYFLDTNG